MPEAILTMKPCPARRKAFDSADGLDYKYWFGLIIEDLQSGMTSPKASQLILFVDAYAMFFTLPDDAVSTGRDLFAKLAAASINAENSGCPALGVEVNSG
jgi:hypothetical protein